VESELEAAIPHGLTFPLLLSLHPFSKYTLRQSRGGSVGAAGWEAVGASEAREIAAQAALASDDRQGAGHIPQYRGAVRWAYRLTSLHGQGSLEEDEERRLRESLVSSP